MTLPSGRTNFGISLGTDGWAFTTDHAITVTSIGWWDYLDDGLVASHQVGIWNSDGVLMLSTTVASGTTDPLIDHFRFNATLTGDPTLGPGYYVIGGLSNLDDYGAMLLLYCGTDPCPTDYPSATTAPGITYIQNRFSETLHVFGYPAGMGSPRDPASIFGPSFQFDNVAGPAAPVPEPSAFLFSGFSCLIFAGTYATCGRAKKKGKI